MADALFVGNEFLGDVEAFRDAEVFGKHLVVFNRTVLVSGDRAKDDQMGFGVVGKSADGEVDVLVVAHGAEGEEDLFAPADFPAAANGLGIFADVRMALGSERDLNGLDERWHRRRVGESFMGNANSERAERERGVEILPPFRAEVVLARGEVEVGRVDGFPEKRCQHVRPNPNGGLRGDMAAGKHDDGFAVEDFPAEAQLVDEGLERFGHLARHDVAGATGGAFQKAGENRVVSRSGADEVRAAQDKNIQAELVKRAGLTVDLVSNRAVRSGTMNQQVKLARATR